MLPESKYRSRPSSNRWGELLVTNIQTTDIYRPTAVNMYIKRKNQEIKNMRAEIKRVTMGDQVYD